MAASVPTHMDGHSLLEIDVIVTFQSIVDKIFKAKSASNRQARVMASSTHVPTWRFSSSCTIHTLNH